MPQRVFSFHYTLTDKTGKLIDSSKGRPPLAFMEGAGQIIPGLEKQLVLLKKGDKKKVEVVSDEGYGQRDEEKILTVPRHELPSNEVKVGDRFSGGQERHAPIFIVTKITEKEVTLDGNHALAGMDLFFDVEVAEVREATAEELSHGHAHGGDGHSHG